MPVDSKHTKGTLSSLWAGQYRPGVRCSRTAIKAGRVPVVPLYLFKFFTPSSFSYPSPETKETNELI